ncbi:hypothetical protein [Psychrobacter sp. FME61]|uniref:hypothetical protein n=1 Tax=Psychrobacter sp. FME61 TaxID=2742611 RepID=UPI0018676D70|nr:hypothetical protein [Psychrobacter sp. FME61]
MYKRQSVALIVTLIVVTLLVLMISDDETGNPAATTNDSYSADNTVNGTRWCSKKYAGIRRSHN